MSECKPGWKELQISSSHAAGVKCVSSFSKMCQALHTLSHKTPIKSLKNSLSAISQLIAGDNYLGLVFTLHKKSCNLSSSWLFNTFVMKTWWPHHLYLQERQRLDFWKKRGNFYFILNKILKFNIIFKGVKFWFW